METKSAVAVELPQILAVMEFDLVVGTDDRSEGDVVRAGCHYLLLREFVRLQPVLASVYQLDIQWLPLRSGSLIYGAKVWFKRRKSVEQDERQRELELELLKLKVEGARLKNRAVALGMLLAAFKVLQGVHEPPDSRWPPASALIEHVETQLRAEHPALPIGVELREVREPDARDTFDKKGGQSFEL